MSGLICNNKIVCEVCLTCVIYNSQKKNESSIWCSSHGFYWVDIYANSARVQVDKRAEIKTVAPKCDSYVCKGVKL